MSMPQPQMESPERERTVQRIQEALDHGRLVVTEATGMERSMNARCPKDGHDSPVYMVSRVGERIDRVIFKCPYCSDRFDVGPEGIYLL